MKVQWCSAQSTGYICVQNWVKFLSLGCEIWSLQGFGSLPTVTLTLGFGSLPAVTLTSFDLLT